MYPNQEEANFQNASGSSDSESDHSILARQEQKLQLDERNILLMGKKLEYEARLAEQTLKYKTIHLHEAPRNKRRLIITQTIAAGFILLLILSFISYCLYIGKDDTVNKLIVFFTHTVTLTIGLFIGGKVQKKEKGQSDNGDSPNAEMGD